MSDRLLLCCLLKLLITFHSLAEEVNENLPVKNTAEDLDDEGLVPADVPESTSERNGTTANENATAPDVTQASINDSESLILDNSTKRKKQADNATELNSTSSDLPKWHCKQGNNTERNESLRRVLVVDADELLRWVNTSTDNESDACAVVLFYTPYCPFCAKLAPLYNTLGRVYSSLPVLAIDAYKHHSLNTRFGVVAVPTILLFHSGKPVLKFNNSFSFDDLKDFVKNNTGIEGNYSIQVSQEDTEGPVPGVPIEERDSYLVFSVLFLVVFGFVMFAKSSYGQLFLDRVRGIRWKKILQLVRRDKQD